MREPATPLDVLTQAAQPAEERESETHPGQRNEKKVEHRECEGLGRGGKSSRTRDASAEEMYTLSE